MANFINLEHKALLQARADLTHGIRAGIKSLCSEFYSEELLVFDLYDLSQSSHDTSSLADKVLDALLDRVRVDRSAFGKIVKVLHTITSLGYLGEMLTSKLSVLQEAHARTVQLQADHDEKMAKKQDLVMQPLGNNFSKRSRPCTIRPNGIANLRDASVGGISTEPAATTYKSAQVMFQATSLGSSGVLLNLTDNPQKSNWSSPMKIMEPVDKTQHRKDSHAQLETGMRFPFSQATPSLANQPDIGYSMNKTEQLLTNGPRAMLMQSDLHSRSGSEHTTLVTDTKLDYMTAGLEATRITEKQASKHSSPATHPTSAAVYTRACTIHSAAGHQPSMAGYTLSTPSVADHTSSTAGHTPSTPAVAGYAHLTAGHTPSPPSVGDHTPSTAGHTSSTPAVAGYAHLTAGHTHTPSAPSVGGHTPSVPSVAGHTPSTASRVPTMEENWDSTAKGPLERYISVPETIQTEHRDAMLIDYKPTPIHVHSNSNATLDSGDQYITPPTSPNPEGSLTSTTSTQSAGCDRCFEMKRTISELEDKITTLASEKSKLEASGENEQNISRQQIDSLCHELHQAEADICGKKMAYEKRHAEQEAIIANMQARLEYLENEKLRSLSGQGGSTEGERRLLGELREEKLGRKWERLNAIFDVQTERLNTERERAEKEWLREYCQQLLQEHHWLSSQVKRANSLQCDNEEGCAGDYNQSQPGVGSATFHALEGVDLQHGNYATCQPMQPGYDHRLGVPFVHAHFLPGNHPLPSHTHSLHSSHTHQPPSSHTHQPPSSHTHQPPSSHTHQPPSSHTHQPPSSHTHQPPSSHTHQPPSSHTRHMASPPSHTHHTTPCDRSNPAATEHPFQGMPSHTHPSQSQPTHPFESHPWSHQTETPPT